MPNASDFGFSIEGQLPSTDNPDWLVISRGVVNARQIGKLAKLAPVAFSSDVVSLLATHLSITSIDATPLVECYNRERDQDKVRKITIFRNLFDLPLKTAVKVVNEIERIEALIEHGKALREGRLWTISGAAYDGRAKVLVEKSDHPTYQTADWQNMHARAGAFATGGKQVIGDRTEALTEAVRFFRADHYEIEVID